VISVVCPPIRQFVENGECDGQSPAALGELIGEPDRLEIDTGLLPVVGKLRPDVSANRLRQLL
jgi:hypothetical protein